MGFQLQFPSSLSEFAIIIGFIVLLLGLLWLLRRFAPDLVRRFPLLITYIPARYVKDQAQPGALPTPKAAAAPPDPAIEVRQKQPMATAITPPTAATSLPPAPLLSTDTVVIEIQPAVVSPEAETAAKPIMPMPTESTSLALSSRRSWQDRRPAPLHPRPTLGQQQASALRRN